eukprot:TRINITY_DN5953_c0_g1_i1.p1 TRINITY_DN5953_c0_g1~~TRINITY_DN5953_c0_g1_i1.p1  ORF type:complete len:368 (-),score=67.82 TRINITY_DN5953_c0_g1_i1:457-1560(-)
MCIRDRYQRRVHGESTKCQYSDSFNLSFMNVNFNKGSLPPPSIPTNRAFNPFANALSNIESEGFQPFQYKAILPSPIQDMISKADLSLWDKLLGVVQPGKNHQKEFKKMKLIGMAQENIVEDITKKNLQRKWEKQVHVLSSGQSFPQSTQGTSYPSSMASPMTYSPANSKSDLNAKKSTGSTTPQSLPNFGNGNAKSSKGAKTPPPPKGKSKDFALSEEEEEREDRRNRTVTSKDLNGIEEERSNSPVIELRTLSFGDKCDEDYAKKLQTMVSESSSDDDNADLMGFDKRDEDDGREKRRLAYASYEEMQNDMARYLASQRQTQGPRMDGNMMTNTDGRQMFSQHQLPLQRNEPQFSSGRNSGMDIE